MTTARISRTGIEFDPDLSYEEWLAFGRERLAPSVNHLAWALGDWLGHAFLNYPRNIWKDVDFLGLDTQLLREFEQIAGHTNEDARNDGVGWGKYLLAVRRHGRVYQSPEDEPPPARCRGCQGPLYTLSGRDRKHCTNACRQLAYRQRVAARSKRVGQFPARSASSE